MPFKLDLGENVGFVIFCVVLVVIAFTFFLVLYVTDFREKRRIAKKKQRFERAARKHKQRHP